VDPDADRRRAGESVFDLVVAGKRNSEGEIDIAMVEAGATEEALRLIEAGQAPSDEAAVARVSKRPSSTSAR
jgi:hypothetical protein